MPGVLDRVRRRKPDFLSFEEASSISLTALTAYQALVKDPAYPLTKGQSVFVNGGAGGVALFSTQIARHIVGPTGKVVATCSAANAEFLKQNGADETIDYKSVNLPNYLAKTYHDARFDLVLDCIGLWDLYNASPAFLNEKGTFLVIGLDLPQSFGGVVALVWKMLIAMYLPGFLGGVPRKLKPLLLKSSKEALEEIGKLVEGKEIKPVLDSTYEFDDKGVQAAYAKMKSHHARGKVVIKIAI